MFLAQRHTYPLSAHIEFPGEAPRNPWQQAFVWIRANTPPDAVFAANPAACLSDGEDAQGFRATTERSLLADDKDEGVVVVFPALARALGCSSAMPRPDSTGSQTPSAWPACSPLGATWLLLSSNAATSFPCPYRNSASRYAASSSEEKITAVIISETAFPIQVKRLTKVSRW